MWHTTGEDVLTCPVGGWLQPLSGRVHTESPESKRRIKALMDVSGLTDALVNGNCESVSMEDILRVHSKNYIDKIKLLSDTEGGEAGPGARFGRGSFEIASISSGLAKHAVADVLSGCTDNAFSLCRPPGHHCMKDQGMGFCMLSNIAIAVEYAKEVFGVDKVAVVDWDVHHGNGTQSLFYHRNDVFTISIHQENCYPADSGAFSDRGEGEGKGNNINVPLIPGGGHNCYMYAFDRIVIPALRLYAPDIIIVASGLDANAYDPLARMLLHSESYRSMATKIKEVATDICNGRIVIVHEGGYSESYVPFCGLAVVEVLSDYRTPVEDPFLEAANAAQPSKLSDSFQEKLIDDMHDVLSAEGVL
jgi:acetoin utilization deacetylase AcuC-like enzyme